MATDDLLLENQDVEVKTQEEKPSLRETLELAFDESAEPAPPSTTPSSPDPAKVTEGQPPSAPLKTKQEPLTPVDDGKKSKSTETTPQELKAPSQWKPAVREKWNQLPREVQEEVLRREADSMRLIGSTGSKVRFADEVNSYVEPFRQVLNQNGISDSAFVRDVFDSVKVLAAGSPRDKVETVANIIQSYGIDLRALDMALTNRIKAPPELVRAQTEAALARTQLQQHQAKAYQSDAQAATDAVASFAADPKHEFFEDVREMMGDLVESGRSKSLEDAYTAAIWAHPDTRKILLQREAHSRAASRQTRATAARIASSAVHGSPSTPTSPGLKAGASLRDAIEAAFDEHSSP